MMGLLGQFGQAMAPIGQTLAPMHQPIADNRMALMGLGAGLMSGPMSTAMPQAMEAMMRGGLIDQRQRAAQMEQLEAERKRHAQLQMAKALGLDPVFADSPSVLNAVAADRFKSKEPTRQSFTEQQWNQLSPEDQAKARRGMFKLDDDEPKRPMTPDIIEYEYAKSQGEKRPFPEWLGAKGKGGAATLSATDRKAIQESDESVAAAETVIGNLNEAKKLSANAFYGPGAGIRGQYGSTAGAILGVDTPQAKATASLENLTGLNAVENLKAVFGGQPTEGERKVLMDLQGSVSQPDSVRQEIYNRAIALAEKRLKFNRNRADEMRGGTYYSPGGGGGAPTAPAGPSRAELEAEARRRGLIP